MPSSCLKAGMINYYMLMTDDQLLYFLLDEKSDTENGVGKENEVRSILYILGLILLLTDE